MGHNCSMHVSELSSPALNAEAGAHSLGTGAHSAFYRALSTCRNRLCTHSDTIVSKCLSLPSALWKPYGCSSFHGRPFSCVFGFWLRVLAFCYGRFKGCSHCQTLRRTGSWCSHHLFSASESWRARSDPLSQVLFGHNNLLWPKYKLGLLLISDWH